jgi:flagellin
MIIQHNIAAANAYRNMKSNRSGLSRNLEKLSSGYRINRSADDAAGLAISEEMRAKINGLNQAEMNVDDGIGLIQTADGAMTEIHAMLERGVTLTTQAANGTYNDVSRDAIQKELDELGGEINRISESTEFNGIKVLQGQHMTLRDGERRVVGTLPKGVVFDSGTAQNEYYSTTYKESATFTVSYIDPNSNNKPGTQTVTSDLTYVASEVDFSNYETGAKGGFNFTCCTCDEFCYSANLVSGTDVTVDDFDGWLTYNIGVDGITKDQIVDRIISAMDHGNPGGHFTRLVKDSSNPSKLILFDERTVTTENEATTTLQGTSDFSRFTITGLTMQSAYGSTFARLTMPNAEYGTVREGIVKLVYEIEVEGVPDVILQIGPSKEETLDVRLPKVNTESLYVNDVKVDTVAHAARAMEDYQYAIKALSLDRARFGAYENRLEHTRNYLGIASENTTAAESRIRDTDMAKEMAAYTKNNILAQAAQSMLAQANQSGQGVLSLLQG